MNRGKISAVRVLVLLLLLLLPLAECKLPDQPAEPPPAAETPPEGALSFDQLLANLDALQGPSAKDLRAGGLTLSAQDLALYLNAIKTDLAAFVKSRMGGKPYLVVARKLSWTGASGPESALMWVPIAWGLRAPIILYQHGTQVYEQCAPSRYNPNPLAVLTSKDLTGALQSYVECTVGALMATAGYIVVMPDYVGFGDSSLPGGPDHPYVTLALGQSVKGALQKAASSFNWWSPVKPNGRVFLTGYSEGGYATMAGALALQAGGALPAGYSVRGIVPCDGAYDLSDTMLKMMLSTEPILMPSYLLYAASGFHSVYPYDPDHPDGINYSALLVSPFYTYLYGGLFDGTHTNTEVGIAAPASVAPRSMLTDFAADTLLKDGVGGTVFNLLELNNAWTGWDPTATTPVYLIHCPDDDVVPYANATRARDNLPPAASPQIIDVPALPLVKTLLGTEHVAAYPTAMFAAFLKIDYLNH